MNNEPNVKEDVRQRVLRAAQELGYHRNNAARALTSGRSHRIGVVSLGTALFGPASVLFAFERAARQSGYSLSVANTFEGDPGGIQGAIQELLEQGVDGIVLSEPIDEGPLDLDVSVPLLVVGNYAGLSSADLLFTSSLAHEPAQMATEHLLSLGHKTVHHVAGPQRWFSARDRERGWRLALSAADAHEPHFLEGDWTAASGYAAGKELAQDPDVTAVFVANDEMAIGVISALTEAGRTVPSDVSVVGYDDIPAAAFLIPPLTTVNQAFGHVAEAGMAALVARIDRPDQPSPEIEEPPAQLIVRGSTCEPRAAPA